MGRSIRRIWASKSGMSSTRSVVTVSISVMPRAYPNLRTLSRFKRTVSRNIRCAKVAGVQRGGIRDAQVGRDGVQGRLDSSLFVGVVGERLTPTQQARLITCDL